MPPSPSSLLSSVDYAGILRVALEWYFVVVLGVFAVLALASLADGYLARKAPRLRRARVSVPSMRFPLGGGHHVH